MLRYVTLRWLKSKQQSMALILCLAKRQKKKKFLYQNLIDCYLCPKITKLFMFYDACVILITDSGIPNLKINKGGTETILCEDIDKANALVNQFSSVFTMEPGDEFTALDNATVHMEIIIIIIIIIYFQNK